MISIRIITLSLTMALSLPPASSHLPSKLILIHLPIAGTATMVETLQMEGRRASGSERRHHRQPPEFNQTRTHLRILPRSPADEARTIFDNDEDRNDGSTNHSTHTVDSYVDTGTDREAITPRKEKKMITSKEQCSPMGECELCPRHWKSLLEKEQDEEGFTIASENGEYGSCTKYGRRQQFECTVLVHGERPLFYS